MSRTSIVFSCVLLLAIGASVGAQSQNQPDPHAMPPGHPPMGTAPTGPAPEGELPQGHPPTTIDLPKADVAEPPPADPADVESIDAIVGAYYDTLCGGKGVERDWDRLRSLFQPLASLVAARPAGPNHTGIWVMKLEEYIAFNRTYFERGGYFEREVARRVEVFGNIAQVWSTYEARHTENGPPYSRGIYSFQLLRDGPRWWIVNVFWDYERPDAPIPDEYLLTP
ncbi:MAG: DUF4440 domain-containing protein [Phycisphaeraceae bacterium]|nr:DUF4440 domain-containing protein [Phycisphaeraceae bacterium]MCB9848650.1 DUF4440 domain-containing protein [Phycisphaeraceae bacterium]